MIRYLILTIRTPNFDPTVVEAHKNYLAHLKEKGILELAGPFTDKSGGAYTIIVESHELAKEIAFNDPVHTTGSSKITIYEWDSV